MLLEVLGLLALLFGLFFCAVGVVGVIRLPDALTRLHASGKVAVLGLFGLLLGAALLMPSASLRLLTLALFILLTSPVATHAIAASVYRRREIASELHRRREITSELLEQESPEPEAEVSPVDVNVTAVLARSRIHDILEALEQGPPPTLPGASRKDDGEQD